MEVRGAAPGLGHGLAQGPSLASAPLPGERTRPRQGGDREREETLTGRWPLSAPQEAVSRADPWEVMTLLDGPMLRRFVRKGPR
jgi:hypothetical protein